MAALALSLSFSAALAQGRAPLPDYVIAEFGEPPAIPEGPLSDELAGAIQSVVLFALAQSDWVPTDTEALDIIANSDDPRIGWLVTDMQRFAWRPEFNAALSRVAGSLLESDFTGARQRAEMIDHMIAWEIPAYPGYLTHKTRVFTNYLPEWDRIFVEGDIDWHLVGWGGVNIDNRPEIREMVNDTLGGRDLGIPYCTLCGAAQAYFTDRLPAGVKRPVLRTSGLLIRSNKVMYDVETYSVFDTFLGKAVTGPLAEIGLELEQATVVTSDWGSWRAAYPQTTVLVERLALGRDFDLRNTRDANGPIFPVGDVDPRLPVHEDVIGVITESGWPVAFQRSRAVAALQAGQEITVENVSLKLDAGGVRAVDKDGSDLGSHQAFWFAWSQFHPDTVLWPE